MLASIAALLSGQSTRLLGHLQLYGDLVSAEATLATRQLLQRMALTVIAVELLACGITLAGVAVLVAALASAASNPLAPWAIWSLWVVPAAPLLVALLVWLKLRQGPPLAPFATLRKQVAADAQWLAERERIAQASR